MKGKRLVFPSERRVEIEEFELPGEPAADEVLLENLTGLISPGTELAMFTKTHVGFADPANTYARYPFVPGYSAVGRAILVGAEARKQGIREGEVFLHRGKHASYHMATIRPERWSMTERVPAGVDPRHAMFTVLAEVSLTAVLLSHLQPGQNVAVFGQGLVGNLAAQLMRACGARRVIVLDPVRRRLEIAARCGMTWQVDPTAADWKKALAEAASPAGCHVVVEATGNPAVAGQALQAAARFGKVVLLGSPRGSATIDLYNQIHAPGVSVIGAHAAHLPAAQCFNAVPAAQVMLEFIADGRLTVEPLITHAISVAEAGTAYFGLLEKPAEYLGVLLDLSKW